MKPLKFLGLFGLIILLGCNQDLLQDQAVPSSHQEFFSLSTTLDKSEKVRTMKKSVPFKGKGLYMPDPGISLSCSCAFLAAPDAGSGNLTHMGNVTSESHTCVDDFITLPDSTIIGFSILSQCVSVVAANGDEVTLELAAPFIMLFDPDCACITGIGEYNITGGTGRFEGACGLVSIRAENNLAGQVKTEWDGHISF